MTHHDRPLSFSYGVDRFFSILSANGQPEGERRFPPNAQRAVLRFQGKESIREWFVRCVTAFVPNALSDVALEDNLAAFAIVSWRDSDTIDFASINILKTECDLHDYISIPHDCSDKELLSLATARYFRLDVDYGTLGPMATHPLPHIHFDREDSPRATLDASASTNVIVDFIDYVYRHLLYDRWLEWAKHEWKQDYLDRGRPPQNDPFDRIASAFAENQIAVLHEYEAEISEMKRVLSKTKETLFDLRIHGPDRRLMMFPDFQV